MNTPKTWTRSRRFNRHHLTPRSRGGQTTIDNLLKMDESRHNAFHFLFNNLTLDEIISLLERVKTFKRRFKCKQAQL